MTLDQAKNLTYGTELHYTGYRPCQHSTGPRGGVSTRITRVRVSGAVKTWRRSPERVSVPVKYGLYESGYVTERTLNDWHLAGECPALAPAGAR